MADGGSGMTGGAAADGGAARRRTATAIVVALALIVLLLVLLEACTSISILGGSDDAGGDDGLIEVDFAEGADEWTVVGDADSVGAVALVDGAIVGEDDTVGGVWYFSAPSSFFGELTADAVLSWDLRTDADAERPFDDPDVVVFGGDEVIYVELEDPPGTEWRTYRVDFAEVDWQVGRFDDGELTVLGRDPVADQAVLDRVFANPTGLWIRGEFNVGDDVGYLDNVVLRR